MHTEIVWEIAWSVQPPVLFINLESAVSKTVLLDTSLRPPRFYLFIYFFYSIYSGNSTEVNDACCRFSHLAFSL